MPVHLANRLGKRSVLEQDLYLQALYRNNVAFLDELLGELVGSVGT